MDAEAGAADLRTELATKDARIVELEALVLKQSEALTQLHEMVEKNSTNSNLPPSGRASGGKKNQSKKKRGGQKGHRGSHWELLPAAKVDAFVDFFPEECANRWAALPEVIDALAKRYQQTDLVGSQPHLTEYRRHAVRCASSGCTTKAAFDGERIPSSSFGPRLMSVVAMLTGDYHISRRKTVRLMWDVLGVRISLGAVSNIENRIAEAIEPAVVEAFEQVLRAGSTCISICWLLIACTCETKRASCSSASSASPPRRRSRKSRRGPTRVSSVSCSGTAEASTASAIPPIPSQATSQSSRRATARQPPTFSCSVRRRAARPGPLIRPLRLVQRSGPGTLAEVGGVNIHAAVAVNGRDRKRLERYLHWNCVPLHCASAALP